MNDLGLPDDLDKRLQRQLLSMDPESAEAYAAFVGGVVDKILQAAKADDGPGPRFERAV